jgi:hypothetical protein
MCVISLCTCGALDTWSRGGSTAALGGYVTHLAKVLVLLFLTLVAPAVRAQPVADAEPCSTEVAAVVAAALKHALVDARDLPDLLLVEGLDLVYVSNYLQGTECVVEDAVLPTSSTRTYVLLSRDEARMLANQRGEHIVLARAGEVEFADGDASVIVGAILRLPEGDERDVLCCCGGQMFLRREAGIWVFARWGMKGCI